MTLLHLLADTDPRAATYLLPRAASNLSVDVDWAWNVILWTTTVFFCIVVGCALLFVLKYRRRHPNEKTSEITHNTPLEVAWTLIPLIIVIAFFFVGFKGFLNYDTPVTNARIVQLQGRQWGFTFSYPNGAQDANLYLEKDIPVRLDMTSSDVLHAFYIPAFRTQRNLIFGRTTYMWFIPEELSPLSTGKDDLGGFDAFCTQYCGKSHSTMGARVYVLAKVDYDKKMTELANPLKHTDPVTKKSHWVPYVQLGESIYKQNCISCHTVTGADSTGPTWKGLWKSNVSFSQSNEPGYSLAASDSDAKWEAYIKESVLVPSAKIVAGKQNQMPSFASNFGGDPGSVKDEQLHAIIAYMKSIGNPPLPPAFPVDSDVYDADKNPKFHPESYWAAHPEEWAKQNTPANP